VAEVAVAVGAQNLGAHRAHRCVAPLDDAIAGEGGEKARPAAVRIELGVTAKQLGAAGAACVGECDEEPAAVNRSKV